MGFRPLAGISCFFIHIHTPAMPIGFRPLAGISCFVPFLVHGLQHLGFRPLAGISCFLVHVLLHNGGLRFSSPSGD